MVKKLNVLVVFGTRPEVIKLAPVIAELKKYPSRISCKVCVTGQHRQMIDPLLKLFKIKVDHDLDIMRPNQNLEHITIAVLEKIGPIFDIEKTDWVIVQGDTTTAMAAGLAGFYKKIKVAHIEAGLRTWDNENPYPEEVNRRIIDTFADVYFAHTPLAQRNLLNEGVPSSKIVVTGNTVIDALFHTARQKYVFKDAGLKVISSEKRKIILVTAHRRENTGEPILNICKAIKHIALKYKDEVLFIYPVHLNPKISGPVHQQLGNIENVLLTKPLEYLPFVQLIKRSYFLLTDSGGLQEEAPSLGKPVLVMRKTTERPEGIKAGCVKVVGTDTKTIIKTFERLLQNKKEYEKMSRVRNPYGDGKTSQRIVQWLLKDKRR